MHLASDALTEGSALPPVWENGLRNRNPKATGVEEILRRAVAQAVALRGGARLDSRLGDPGRRRRAAYRKIAQPRKQGRTHGGGPHQSWGGVRALRFWDAERGGRARRHSRASASSRSVSPRGDYTHAFTPTEGLLYGLGPAFPNGTYVSRTGQ